MAEVEQMLTGEHNGGDMKIGGKKRKLISAHGDAVKKGKTKKHSKKSHRKVAKRKLL